MGGCVELRVHGVSGTSAEALLGVGVDDLAPPIAGDDLVQFTRPRDQGPPDGHVLEGMSWGRLTSGAVIQALWLLLLPYALANLAYWARPWEDRDKAAGMGSSGEEAYAGDPGLAQWHRVLVRVVSIGLTAVMMFTAATITLDLVAWQCWVTRSATCTSTLPLTGWLDAGVGWPAGLALAVGALAPVIVVLGLALLSTRATLRYETFRVDDPEGDGGDDPHLFSRRMWHGELLVSRLRNLHVATGLLVLAVIAVRLCANVGAPGWLTALSGVITVAGWVVVVLLVVAPRWLRWTDEAPRELLFLSRPVVLWGPGVVVLVVQCAWLLLGTVEWAGLGLEHVPGLINVGHVIVLVQLAVLLALGVVHLLARARLGAGFGLPGVSQEPTDGGTRLAAGGGAAWLIAAMSAILGFGYSAALVFRSAGVVGGAVLPAFEIAAGGTGVFVLVAVVWAAWRWASVWQRRKAQATASVEEEYADELSQIFPDGDVRTDDYRVSRVVRPRALALLTSFDLLGRVFAIASVVGILTGIYSGLNAIYTFSNYPEVPPLLTGSLGVVNDVVGALTPFGSWVVTLVALGLIAAGTAAWRSERSRRLVGIIWDITCFWPRAAHPFAPPCYSERAIPQLACRLSYLSEGAEQHHGAVVLAGHSQGSVISVAALAQLAAADANHPTGAPRADRVALMTFGSPLMRLYAPVFPRIFWPTRLRQLDVARRGLWTNLWRSTDPIGSSLQPALPPGSVDGCERSVEGSTERSGEGASGSEQDVLVPGDVRCVDPTQLTMVPSRSAYAPVRGHVDYQADPTYAVCLDRLAHAVRRRLPQQ